MFKFALASFCQCFIMTVAPSNYALQLQAKLASWMTNTAFAQGSLQRVVNQQKTYEYVHKNVDHWKNNLAMPTGTYMYGSYKWDRSQILTGYVSNERQNWKYFVWLFQERHQSDKIVCIKHIGS